ncbi:uncharacterized protein C5L36_0B12460 [Pichia kudriavzevii]|uniref:AAA+ ATPase domain-containing protein n=1 Tax=Pichia kudriavzevii TaxID=4909 RepID=A0A099P4T3_PICKU|nr:uncharacterized protein C5L36_0B12460 [Pichia kudriavzevii]AWU76019.1 hypothetical protein C5L36_0B12460 [Pichia kudriavzevii]KGK39036.1 hypothetical protein JL09_g1855 [Pichia kudriavzevii]
MPPTKTAKKNSNPEKDSATTKARAKASTTKELIIRPTSSQTLKNLRNFASVFITKTTLENLELTKGTFVKLRIGLKELVLLVDVCGSDDDDDDAIFINRAYLDLYGILLGERATINKFNGQLEYAKNMVIEKEKESELTVEDLINVGIVYPKLNTGKWFVKSINEELETAMNNLTLNATHNSVDINNISGYLVHPKNTNIQFISVDKIPQIYRKNKFSDVGGLDKTIESLVKSVKIPLLNGEMFRSFGIEPPRGVLLYGNSGVGKTMLLKSLACEFRECHIIKIDGSSIISKYLGDSEEKLRLNFKEALKYQPSIILIDEIENLLPNRKNREEVSDVDGRIINTFNSMMEELSGNSRVIVIGACNDLTSVDLSLRRPGRLDVEIEVGIPDIEGRFDILRKQINKIEPHLNNVSDEEIKIIADKTHGYVGSDLLTLVRESVMKAITRHLEGENSVCLKFNDFIVSMKDIRPSAMKEILLEMPKVKWSDIGGQTELKQKIHEMVELPLKEVDKFKRFGIKAPKGLLLYGPPGCSKTMTAKALATESGLNFLAIKGPEIFDKYVGESERKIRDIFNKARASAPSIIFIDEIDAIAVDREGGESTNVSKQVLNTMLNELDGVEELNGVILVGATNRPSSIDSALLRPGRLDRHVYVGPPDAEGRKAIFSNASSSFGIDEGSFNALIDWIVNETEGCSGAECVLLCREAGVRAVSRGADHVTREDFESAISHLVRNITQEMLDYYQEFACRA